MGAVSRASRRTFALSEALRPLLLAVTVTPLILGYGKHGWGWAMPLVLAAVLWLLDRKAREPSEPAPAHSAHSEPAPVD